MFLFFCFSCLIFSYVDRQTDRQTHRQTDRQIDVFCLTHAMSSPFNFSSFLLSYLIFSFVTVYYYFLYTIQYLYVNPFIWQYSVCHWIGLSRIWIFILLFYFFYADWIFIFNSVVRWLLFALPLPLLSTYLHSFWHLSKNIIFFSNHFHTFFSLQFYPFLSFYFFFFFS